jgi:hypothetical protein
MRPTIPLLLFGAISCSTTLPAPRDFDSSSDTFRSYRTWDATAVQSTLMERAEPSQHVLRGHTQLEDGSWLMEQATLDNQGRLLRAEIDRGGPCAEHATHIVLDAQRGTVEVHAPQLTTRWSVPSDLPWVPMNLMGSNSVATPLDMTIALRSARAERASRLVDVEHYASATIMSDQLLVSDTEQTVVLGDDYADVQDGLPSRVHLAALDRDLDASDPDLTAAWARLRCKNPKEGTAL